MHGRISFKEYRDALDKWNETTTKFSDFYKGLVSDEFTSKITKAVHDAKSQLKDCIEKWAVEAEEETSRDEFISRWENGKPVLTPEQKYLGEKIGDLMDKVKEGGLKSAEVIHIGENSLLGGQPLLMRLMLDEKIKKEVEGYNDEEMKSQEEIILSSVEIHLDDYFVKELCTKDPWKTEITDRLRKGLRLSQEKSLTEAAFGEGLVRYGHLLILFCLLSVKKY